MFWSTMSKRKERCIGYVVEEDWALCYRSVFQNYLRQNLNGRMQLHVSEWSRDEKWKLILLINNKSPAV